MSSVRQRRVSATHVTYASMPPGRSTRRISRRALKRFGTSWRTNDDITASKVSSSNGSWSAKAVTAWKRRSAPGSAAAAVLRGGNHLARRIDRVHLRRRPALQRGERQRPGPGSDVQEAEAPAVESIVEPVEERPGARRDHRCPPARVALRDPVVAFGLVGHRGMVPRPGDLRRLVSRLPTPLVRSGRPDRARRTAATGTRRCRRPRRT